MAEKEEIKRGELAWTMNCVIFGAELLRSLYRGQISKADAITRIKNLTSEFDDTTANYLLQRLINIKKGGIKSEWRKL